MKVIKPCDDDTFRCPNCIYSEPIEMEAGDFYYVCRVNAPVAENSEIEKHYPWPLVHKVDWCGRFSHHLPRRRMWEFF